MQRAASVAWAFFVTRLTETVYQESAPRVDADAGILYGVKILGEASKNGRRYKAKGMKEAAAKYNGVKAYVDHPEKERLSEDRKFKDWSGVFQNATYREGQGIFADLHLRKTSDYFDGIVEAAEKFPRSVGFSHVAEGESHYEGETEIVESIKEVFSVDLVTDPATTAGFFESRKRKPLPSTIRTALESLPESTQRTTLIEMAGEYMDLDSDPAPKDDMPADEQGQIAKLLNTCITLLGETLKALAMKQDSPPPVPAAPAPNQPQQQPQQNADPNAAPEDEEKKKANPFESENRELRAKLLLVDSGLEATPARVKALANAADEDRQELVESWDAQPRGERPAYSPALFSESAGDTDFDFSQPGSFASRYR
jgi:hypothetical protein